MTRSMIPRPRSAASRPRSRSIRTSKPRRSGSRNSGAKWAVAPPKAWLVGQAGSRRRGAGQELEHARQYPVGWPVAVDEGLDVDHDLLAHVDPALDRRGAHVRQKHDVVEFAQLWVDRWLVLEDVEAGAGDLAVPQHPGERGLVDHLAPRGVDDDRIRPHQLEAARGEQMEARGGVRAVDADDVHPRHHLIEAVPVGRLEFA